MTDPKAIEAKLDRIEAILRDANADGNVTSRDVARALLASSAPSQDVREALEEEMRLLRVLVDTAEARINSFREALVDAAAHLAGAASAYRRHAARSVTLKPRAVADALFSTRVLDFEKAAERARAALSPPEC